MSATVDDFGTCLDCRTQVEEWQDMRAKLAAVRAELDAPGGAESLQVRFAERCQNIRAILDDPEFGPRTDPAKCRPWCRDRAHGHTAMFADHCSTTSTPITLALGALVDYGSGDMRPDVADVYLWQDVAEDVTVNVAHHEEAGPMMTVHEARQLGEELIRLAELAEAAGR